MATATIRGDGLTGFEGLASSIKVSQDGRLIDNNVITSRMMDEEGTIVVTTSYRGEDDHRPAKI
jgi:hypothetical protein